jgi:hypothetical protein
MIELALLQGKFQASKWFILLVRSRERRREHSHLAVLGGGHRSVERSLGTRSEGIELEDSWWAVPEDGLSLIDGVLEELNALWSAVESHPACKRQN